MIAEEIIIPSDPNRLAKIDEITERITGQMAFSREAQDDIAISVSEAVNNAIVHGNKSDPEKSVVIRFIEQDEELKVEVYDEGEGFDPGEIGDPTSPENLMNSKGRGIFIVKHLMDELHLERLSKGMKITMVKRKNNQNVNPYAPAAHIEE